MRGATARIPLLGYDADRDVLYLSIGEPQAASDTPEGHGVRYDENRMVIGVTIVNAKGLLERDGEIKVTFPRLPAVADTREVEAVLAA